jgi:hypothetical protein
MSSRSLARAVTLALLVCGALAAMAGTAGAAKVLYRNIPKKTVALPALGFECCQAGQFGGAVRFTEAPVKVKKHGTKDVFTVVVGLDEYSCEKGSYYTNGKPECTTSPGATFKWPVTLRVNNLGPGNAVGALLAEETKEFTMPYRPSQNNEHCVGIHGIGGPENFGAWFDKKSGECFIDNFFTVSWTLPIATLQQNAIVSVAYNTSDYGAVPQRPKPCDEEKVGTETYDNCPYDSLNVGINAIYVKVGPGEEFEAQPTAPSVGTDPLPEEVFLNSQSSVYYCNNASPNTFAATGTYPSGPKAGKGCWLYEQPAIEVKRP